jgi:hypothetical protein
MAHYFCRYVYSIGKMWGRKILGFIVDICNLGLVAISWEYLKSKVRLHVRQLFAVAVKAVVMNLILMGLFSAISQIEKFLAFHQVNR